MKDLLRNDWGEIDNIGLLGLVGRWSLRYTHGKGEGESEVGLGLGLGLGYAG